jgi:hypothetical protein
MQQTARSPVSTFALLLTILTPATAVPAHAASWPIGHMLPMLPADAPQPDAARITVQVYNHAALVQQVRVGDRVYTLMPYNRVTLKAPLGTAAVALSKSARHRKGDILFAFTPDRNNDTVILD